MEKHQITWDEYIFVILEDDGEKSTMLSPHREHDPDRESSALSSAYNEGPEKI